MHGTFHKDSINKEDQKILVIAKWIEGASVNYITEMQLQQYVNERCVQ